MHVIVLANPSTDKNFGSALRCLAFLGTRGLEHRSCSLTLEQEKLHIKHIAMLQQ